MRKTSGFTMIEVLTVIALIVILSTVGIIAMSSSKRKAVEVEEESALRQIYVAINLYEADYDHESPKSLVDLTPLYVGPSLLDCKRDIRHELTSPDWPANPWANFRTSDGSTDDPAIMRQRTPGLVSYLYLKTFDRRIPVGHTYSEYRNDSNVGLIVGLGLMTCQSKEFFNKCSYPIRDVKIDQGQPAINLGGTLFTCRTDGSLIRRVRPFDNFSTLSLEQAFLFFSLESGRSSAN